MKALGQTKDHDFCLECIYRLYLQIRTYTYIHMYIKVGGPVFQTSKRRGERTMAEWSICSGCFFLTEYGANILLFAYHTLHQTLHHTPL